MRKVGADVHIPGSAELFAYSTHFSAEFNAVLTDRLPSDSYDTLHQ
jgi:hypothetical protein